MKQFYLDIADFSYSIDNAVDTALTYALAATTVANIQRVVIIAPTNTVAKTVDGILLALGYRASGGVYNAIGNSTNIVVNSTSNYNHFDTDAVIYFALDSDEIFKIEENLSFELEIAIKEYGDIDLWKGTWDAINPQTKAHVKLDPNDKIKHAFDQLTRSINITHTAAFHTSDENKVKEFIRTLHVMEPSPVNPDEVFAYIKCDKHWTLGLCNLVRDWISRLNNGKTFKGGTLTKSQMKTLYARW